MRNKAGESRVRGGEAGVHLERWQGRQEAALKVGLRSLDSILKAAEGPRLQVSGCL